MLLDCNYFVKRFLRHKMHQSLAFFGLVAIFLNSVPHFLCIFHEIFVTPFHVKTHSLTRDSVLLQKKSELTLAAINYVREEKNESRHGKMGQK